MTWHGEQLEFGLRNPCSPCHGSVHRLHRSSPAVVPSAVRAICTVRALPGTRTPDSVLRSDRRDPTRTFPNSAVELQGVCPAHGPPAVRCIHVDMGGFEPPDRGRGPCELPTVTNPVSVETRLPSIRRCCSCLPPNFAEPISGCSSALHIGQVTAPCCTSQVLYLKIVALQKASAGSVGARTVT